MTNSQPMQQQPDGSWIPATPIATPQTVKHTKRNIIFAIVVLVFVGLCAGCIAATTTGGTAPTSSSRPIVTAVPAVAPAPAPSPKSPLYVDPVATDFTLTVKVTTKECFGSAGCDIEFTTELTYNGKGAKPFSSWDITYDVIGADDPQTDTIHLQFDGTGTHGQYSKDDLFAQTSSKTTKLGLHITSVTAS